MATVEIPIEDWQTLPWKKFHRNVYRLSTWRQTGRNAFIKPRNEATGSESTIYNGCCCVHGQRAAWRSDK